MKTILATLLICVSQDPSMDELIRRLGSDRVQERDDAQRRLKALGRAALPSIEKAAKRADPEVAARAKRLVDLVLLIEREKLTPEVLVDLPDLDEKMLSLGESACLPIFLDRAAQGEKALRPATWAALAPRAVRSAKTVEDRMKICSALVQLPVKEAAPDLFPYFMSPVGEYTDPDDLLKTAVKALAKMGARRELFRVVTEYGEIRSERRFVNLNTAREAFEALVALKAKEEILSIARKEHHMSGDATQALSELDDPDLIPELLNLLGGKNPWTRYQAALGLGRKGVAEAKAPLLAMLSDPDGPPLRAAMEALAQLGVREGIPRMVRLVHDKRSWVQAAAMRALVALGAAEAAPALQDALTHHDPNVRAVAAQSLGAIRGREAIPDLLPMLRDKEAVVRHHAADGLTRGGSLKGLPVLVAIAEKSEPISLNLGDLMSGGGEAVLPPLLALNAARHPEAWRRLMKGPGQEGLTGIILPDAERIAKQAGLILQLSPEVSAEKPPVVERRYLYGAMPKSMPVRQVLWHFCLSTKKELVMDGPTLRLMTRPEALAEWRRWYLTNEPADDEDRAAAAAIREDLRRAAMPPAERAALEAREKDEARMRHRKERARALEGALTPGLKVFEDRLLEGNDQTWAAIALELAAKPQDAKALAAADLEVIVVRGQQAAAKAEDRNKILTLAHGLKGKEVEQMALGLLSELDGGLRASAVFLLDAKVHSKAILALSSDSNGQVRKAVAEVVWPHHPAESVAILKELSLHPDWQLSDYATMMLQFRGGPDLIPHMIGRLKTSTLNFGSANSALGYLGRQGAREAIPEILLLLEQERAMCYSDAIRALVRLGARDDAPRVLRSARRATDHLMQAAPFIEALDLRVALPDFHTRLWREEEPYGKGSVLKVLARMGDRDAIPQIRKLLQHDYVGLRMEAVEALAILEGPAAKKEVLDVFKDPKARPYLALVRAEAREAIPELTKRLQHYDPELIRALIDLGARDALPAIFAMLEKQDTRLYYSEGLTAVGRAYPRESIPTLRVNLAGGVSNNPSYAAAMLCEAGSTEGVALLLEQGWPTFSLNAVRRPEAWRRLADRSVDPPLYGSGPQLLERIGREAGFKVEGLLPDALDFKAWTGSHHFLPKGARPLRLIEVIGRLEDARWAFVLEEDTIRVLPKADALKIWARWWESAPK